MESTDADVDETSHLLGAPKDGGGGEQQRSCLVAVLNSRVMIMLDWSALITFYILQSWNFFIAATVVLIPPLLANCQHAIG
jgi:hypothetical protein